MENFAQSHAFPLKAGLTVCGIYIYEIAITVQNKQMIEKMINLKNNGKSMLLLLSFSEYI